jgi:hypothetical protein
MGEWIDTFASVMNVIAPTTLVELRAHNGAYSEMTSAFFLINRHGGEVNSLVPFPSLDEAPANLTIEGIHIGRRHPERSNAISQLGSGRLERLTQMIWTQYSVLYRYKNRLCVDKGAKPAV